MSKPTIDGGFPDLRIVAVDDLLLHEEADLERVARLLDRLSADGILRNPPIVASLPGSERYILLDGANRVSAIQNLEIFHLLVQVERFEAQELAISHWNHVIRDLEAEEVTEKARGIDGVETATGELEAASRENPGFLCSIVTRDGQAFHLSGPADLPGRVRRLKAICDIYYRRDARMDRVNHADLESLRHHHPHFGALVLFPDFGKNDVRAVAEADERLPSGVTRILVPRRVLGFNLQLALLKSSLPLDEKRRWLTEEIHHKVTENKVRYYQEPTFVFDD